MYHKAQQPLEVFTAFNCSHQMGASHLHVKNTQNDHAQLQKESNYFSQTPFDMVTCKNTLSFMVSMRSYSWSKFPLPKT